MKTPEEIKKGLEACGADECHGQHKSCPYKDDAFCMMHICSDALAYITQLEARVAKWISVKERLPEDDDDVLILICGKIIGAGYRINGKWKSLAKAKAPVVTHWMPLPEMPKEE